MCYGTGKQHLPGGAPEGFRDAKQPEIQSELDERLLAAPPIALERCREVAADMAQTAVSALKLSMSCLRNDAPELAASVREKEEKTDYYEDILGNVSGEAE